MLQAAPCGSGIAFRRAVLERADPATLKADAGTILISFALEGWAYWVGRLGPTARTSLLAAAALLVAPGTATDVYGAALAAITMVLKALSNRLTLRRVQ